MSNSRDSLDSLSSSLSSANIPRAISTTSSNSSTSSTSSNSSNSSNSPTNYTTKTVPDGSNEWATFKDYPMIPYIDYTFILESCSTQNKSCTMIVFTCICLIIIPSIISALIFSYIPTSVDWKIGVVCYNVFLLLGIVGLYFYIGTLKAAIQADINKSSEKNNYKTPNLAGEYELFNTRTKLWLYMFIIFIILLSLLGKFFGGLSILILVFALGLVCLVMYGFYQTFNQITLNVASDSSKHANIFMMDWSTGGIILGTFIFIAMLLGIFILIFPPKKDPNNPNNAYNNVLTIIYVLLGIIGVIGLIIGIPLISKYSVYIPVFFSKGILYFYTLFSSILGIILYMGFMTYFYNYGGLLTLFAKKNNDGTYDNSIVNNKPVNPASLNSAVATINYYKNKAMGILAPITIGIGLYILYRGYKTETAIADPIFDKFKQIMMSCFGVFFLIHVWTLDPKKSAFHDTIITLFSGKMLVIEIFIAIFAILYGVLNMLKDVASKNENAGIAAAAVGSAAATTAATAILTQNANAKKPYALTAYLILYIIFIIVISVGLTTNYFTPKPRIHNKSQFYSLPTNTPSGQDNGYGICPNNTEYKTDPQGSQCTPCKNTQYGCCDDGVTAKTDSSGTNCGTLQVHKDNPYYISDNKKYTSSDITNTSQGRAGGAVFLIIVVSVIWLGFTFYELQSLGYIPQGNALSTDLNMTRKVFMVISGILISSLIVYVLTTSINGLVSKKKAGALPFIVNLITILVILGILYKILKIDTNPKVNQTYHLIIDIIFYIPCLFLTLYNNVPSINANGLPTVEPKDFTQPTYIIILIVVIILYVVYFYFFNFSSAYTQDGTVVLRDSTSLTKFTAVSNYLKLNKLDADSKETADTTTSSQEGTINKFNYNYGISFWVYLDSINESQIDKYLTILNYGNKPTVEYNPSKNSMRIIVADNDDKDSETRIIYTLNNVLLQKWNNIIINYVGGTVDIFYNGELASSVLNVSPFMSYDALTVGQDNGINGGICNIVYFTKSLTIKQIYYLYNLLKDTNPPVMYDTGQTISNITNNKNDK